MTTPANGDMLRLARQRRKLNQTEASNRLGIEQPVLSRIENGIAEFKPELVTKASSVLSFPEGFFHLRDPIYGAPVSVHPMWRRKAEVTARELDGTIAELNLRVMHLRRLLEGAAIANTASLPQMSIEEFGTAEAIAKMVRAHWKLPAGPLRNLTLLAEKSGVLVVHSPLDGASISGVTFAVPGMPPLIALNSDQPCDRLRFTLAHELGHLIMHRFPTSDMEQEANDFATALLMPADDIKPYFVGQRIDLAKLAALKPEWRVSMAALLMRASSLGYLSSNQSTYLWKQISMKGYRLREPPQLDFPKEVPTVLTQLIRVHVENLGYSAEEMSRILQTSLVDLKEMYALGGSSGDKKPKFTVVR